jgi:hypothetical protein
MQYSSFHNQTCNPDSKPDTFVLGYTNKKLTVSEYAHQILYLRVQRTKIKNEKRKKVADSEEENESSSDSEISKEPRPKVNSSTMIK